MLISGTLSTAALSLFPGSRSPVHVELRLLSGVDPTGARQLLVDMWNRANPNTTVHLIGSEGATGDQRKQMETDARKGVVDIVNLDTIHIRAFVDQNLIVPVEVDDTEVFLAPTIRANRVDGAADRLWAVPFNTDVGMLFERTPAGARPGTPKLAQVIDRLPAGGLQFVGQLAPSSSASHEAFVINILEHALSRDPKIIDADGTPSTTSPRGSRQWNRCTGRCATGASPRPAPRTRRWPGSPPTPDPATCATGPSPTATCRRTSTRTPAPGASKCPSCLSASSAGRAWLLSPAPPPRARHRGHPLPHRRAGTEGDRRPRPGAHPTVRVQRLEPAGVRAAPTAVRGAVEEARPRPAHRNYAAFAQAVSDHLRRLLSDDTPLPSRFIDEMRDALA
ncbi:hypothetical protein ACFQX7_07620 [Luedemannella flava]